MSFFDTLKRSRLDSERQSLDEAARRGAEARAEQQRLESLLTKYTPMVEPVLRGFAEAAFPDLVYAHLVYLSGTQECGGVLWKLRSSGGGGVFDEYFATVRLTEESDDFGCQLTSPARPPGQEYGRFDAKYKWLEARSLRTSAALEGTFAKLFKKSHWPM